MKRIITTLILMACLKAVFSQSVQCSVLIKTSHCQGDTVWFPFNANGVFGADNVFKVEIGPGTIVDAFFQFPVYIGSKASSAAGLDSIMAIVPNLNSLGITVFNYRVIATSPSIHSSANSNLKLFSNPSFSFQSADTVFCVTANPTVLSVNSSTVTASFSGVGISNNIFDPKNAGLGYHYIYCTVTDKNTCSSTDSLKIKVISTPKPNVVISEIVTKVIPVKVYAIGDSIEWFVDQNLTQKFYSGQSFEIQLSDTGTYLYYLTQKQNACRSDANTVKVIFHPDEVNKICLAKKPTVPYPSVSMCEGDIAAVSIKAEYSNFNNIEWFDNPNQSIANKVSDNEVLKFTKSKTAGTWIYYAFEHDTVNNCYSNSGVEFSFIVHPNPKVAISVQDTICFTSEGFKVEVWPSNGILTGKGVASNGVLFPSYTFIHNDFDTLTYIGSDDNGCVASVSKRVFIRFVDLPVTLDKIGYLDSIPELFAIAVDSTSIMRWYEANNETPIFEGEYYTPEITALGIYEYYVVQTWKGCESDKVPYLLKIIPGSGTPVNDVNFGKNNVLPIPANDYLTFSNPTQGVAVIYNIIGKKIAEKKIENNHISIKDLDAGVYLIEYREQGKLYTSKFIKQ